MRTKPYYSKSQIYNFISSGKVYITEPARKSAKSVFGWSINDIKKAILALPQKYYYKSEKRHNNPEIWVDYYKAPDIMGENIYTHFYVDDEMLIIDSFKEI